MANELIERLRDAELYDLDGWESGLPLDAAHALEAADRMADALADVFRAPEMTGKLSWIDRTAEALTAYRATQKDD